MPEFDEARRAIQQARAAREATSAGTFAAKERLERIAARQATRARVFDHRDRSHAAERERLEAERARAERELAERERDETRASELWADALADFGRLADPREQIGRLDDGLPILLLPVRLETRFKRAGTPPRPQLWVRVYPDDCSIDTFEPTLSETEVASAQLYWTGIWESGGIEDQERGAWRGLVASHGSGRSRWIVAQYQPLNLADKPAKPLARDAVLTIPTDSPLPTPEQRAATAFWRAAWLADGNHARVEAARSTLAAAVGGARAAEIVQRYVPANFAKEPASPHARSEVNVGVAFVVFPESDSVATRRHSWSRAPKAVLLPDRFVFVGYSDGASPVVQVGNPVPSPLVVGPDPSAKESDQLHQEEGELFVPDPMRWMVDFDRAVQVGMGFRIDLDETRAARGFDRVLVVGLRLSSDEATAQAELEELIEHHQFSRTGFELVPQGTPTNNTEGVGSGFTRTDAADSSFGDVAAGALFTESFEGLEKRDGQWLAEYLGIDAAVFKAVRHSGGSDQADGRAINVALWPATLGYWMETMMAPVFTPAAVEGTREFFNRYVSGRGAVPAVRIGRQPYGILPATAYSRMRWIRDGGGVGAEGPEGERPLVAGIPGDEARFLTRLYGILREIDADWRRMAAEVSFAGKPGDPHETLLDVLGLHPTSAEFAQRYAESVEQLFNRVNLEGLGRIFGSIDRAALTRAGSDLLAKLGYAGAEAPDILGKFFLGRHNALKGPLVQEDPLSETEGLRAATADGKQNYLEWLVSAANASLNALYAQQEFPDGKPPTALLYLMLRHALQLGYHDTSVRLHLATGLIDAEQVAVAKHDAPFIHVGERATESESRYRLLYGTEAAITGSPTVEVGEYIGASLTTLPAARYLLEQVRALERLKDASTARLERAFVEHVDCCIYRLDAWLLGLVHRQLALMRNLRDGIDTPPRRGVHLGAYAWLEDLRPDEGGLSPVRLPSDLDEIFKPGDDPPLHRDGANQGYIHAPSLNHAVAAAVLRNGYISSASPANRQTMAVNLTSERVRTALGLLEGIRGGQSLGALLGYRFERGLHDRHGLAEVDKFIYDIRKAFPLQGDRLGSTRTEPDVPIEAVEARNVMDGLALVSHVKATGLATYPFGKPLPDATPVEAAAIDTEVERLLESHDAVADLALAEGVYQAMLGNYDRVASTYDAYSRGNFPPEPDVVRTPTSGIGLTHRVALHLESGVDPAVSPIPGVATTPHARAEPALNRWLASVLPPLSEIACVVSFREAATNVLTEREVTLGDLRLQPADLVRLVSGGSDQAMSELDDRIVQFTVTAHAPRPDTPVAIRYMEKVAAPFSVFEATPLVRALHAVARTSRPLRATDLTLTNEATARDEGAAFIDPQRILAVRGGLQQVRNDVEAFVADLETSLADLQNRRDEIIGDFDAHVQAVTTLLSRAALFAILQGGWGFAYEARQRAFAAILAKAADLVTRWDDRLAAFDAVLTEYDDLPFTATDAHRFEVLRRAESLVSTTRTDPLPAVPSAFRSLLVLRRAAFADRRDEFAAVRNTTRTSVALLLADVAGLSTTEFDFVELSLADEEGMAIRFAQDAAGVGRVVVAEMDRRLNASQALLDEHDAAAEAPARVKALEAAAKALLGDDFVVVPEFDLAAGSGGELENALAASRTGTLFEHLTNSAQVDFPVDTWLYGVARVREKMRFWEQVVMLAGALGGAEPDLMALQLPFKSGDRWLGLEFPPETAPDSERLLYTAHFATPFRKTARQCGLLIDEWSEVIPASDATTGLAFHYDRPSSEPPQAMLLVTPSEFRGGWQWVDLVDALNETLDLAKRRAVEPLHVDATAYARFLPATIMAVTAGQLTISANLALNNDVYLRMADA